VELISPAVESTGLVSFWSAVQLSLACLLTLLGYELGTGTQKSTHMNDTPGRETWAARGAGPFAWLQYHCTHGWRLIALLVASSATALVPPLRLDGQFAARLSQAAHRAVDSKTIASATSIVARLYLCWSQTDVTQE